jgi:MerR family mercuric resistance operon transcriptional regulator
MTSKPATIGVAAKKAGVNIETIRYYQRIGLITEPEKPLTGFRTYPDSAIDRIHFIQRAQMLGFSLAEIKHLLELEDGDCEQTRELAEQKLALIKHKIEDLQTIAGVLKKHIRVCRSNTDQHSCPLIGSLTRP